MRLNSITSKSFFGVLPFRNRGASASYSRFSTALRTYGLSRCSVFQQALLVGVRPTKGLYSRIKHLPKFTGAVGFMAGPNQVELISAFLNSPESQRVHHLQIGITPAYHASENALYGFDMSTVLSLFKGQRLPRLKSLSLGDCYPFGAGSTAAYLRGCALGDITPIFEAAPRLEILDLNGPFCLSRPVRHFKLREINVQIDPVAATEATLSQQSLDHLLASDLPLIESLSLHCCGSTEMLLDLPRGFDPQRGMPKLTALSLENLSRDSARRQAALQARMLAG
ncbi:hypothetical protein TM5383_02444 [Thalassovita mediterranea]|uniref:Leucine Rich repeats (2 copies) n=2 Tax=Thalassovita mediterranea TaxID=340021 RepID=A0A0P1H3Z4_9RHOB|nr:hypothetical protein TM5383_02444 [Thalassovita mediterranea]SIS30716.1 hypothetical protein SAMN05421685_103173 [Thalassovita mediterranea]